MEAEGSIFQTTVDSEVIVHLYEELGPSLVEQLDGMFAFAGDGYGERCLVVQPVGQRADNTRRNALHHHDRQRDIGW